LQLAHINSWGWTLSPFSSDCLGSEFGGRRELYEINYGGSTEEIRRYCVFGAHASGNADRFKGFAEDSWPNTTSMAGRCPT